VRDHIIKLKGIDTMNYSLSQEESKKIKEYYGQAFYEKVCNDIQTYSQKWNIEIVKMIDYYSVNCIFICKSQLFGDAVLKICKQPLSQVITEVSTLSEYKGRRYCRLFNSDIDNGIILEECIKPGIQLKYIQPLEKRIDIFMSVFKGLHIEPENPEIYSTYMQWVDKITEYMSNRKDKEEFYLYMRKAREICADITSLYSQKYLLHGDFHYDNILLGENGEYRIIDPKGVIGHPVFDLPRYLLNEYGDNKLALPERYQMINKIINFFENQLQIPGKIIKQSFFVEMAMGACWDIEDGGNPDIQDVVFAEKIMDS
jgi:thiamine kinase-like enzyme